MLTGGKSASLAARLLRLGLWTGSLLLALALGIYAREFFLCVRCDPTGDQLFDRFARAVVRRQAWRLFGSGDKYPCALPESLIAGWEPEFGDKPEYWQLCYWNALQQGRRPASTNEWSEDAEAHRRGLEYLQQGLAKGSGNPQLHPLIALETCWLASFAETSAGTGSLERDAQRTAALRLWQQQVPAAAAPDYAMCFLELERQNYEAAREHLLRAAQAQDQALPDCFPESYFRKRLERSTPLNYCVSKVFSGAMIDSARPAVSIYDFHAVWESGFESWLVGQEALDGLAAWYGLACRLGQRGDPEFKSQFVALNMIRRSLYFSLLSEGLYAPEQRLALLSALSRQSRLALDLRGYGETVMFQQRYFEDWNIVSTPRDWVYYPAAPPQPPLEHYLWHLWLRGSPDGLAFRADLFSDIMFNHQHTAAEFRQLGEIDLKAPRLPVDWVDLQAERDKLPQWHPEGELARSMQGK